jgi:hypothetical protein
LYGVCGGRGGGLQGKCKLLEQELSSSRQRHMRLSLYFATVCGALRELGGGGACKTSLTGCVVSSCPGMTVQSVVALASNSAR